jgi:hypothetical protein
MKFGIISKSSRPEQKEYRLGDAFTVAFGEPFNWRRGVGINSTVDALTKAFSNPCLNGSTTIHPNWEIQ